MAYCNHAPQKKNSTIDLPMGLNYTFDDFLRHGVVHFFGFSPVSTGYEELVLDVYVVLGLADEVDVGVENAELFPL